MTESTTPTLSDEQLAEVLRLIKGADSVELKLTVPDTDHGSAVAALEMDVLTAQIRQVVFFDTPDLTLNQHGVVVRGRRVQGRAGDTVVKLRPSIPPTSRRRCARIRGSASRSTPCPVASSAPAR